MKHSIVKLGVAIIAVAGLSLPAASAMAAEATSPVHATFTVKSAADNHIRSGATEYKKGNYERSIAYSQAALKSSLSPKRAAIAHTNLCAAYANLGDLEKAEDACDQALKLRPNYEAAQANKAALRVQLAAK